MHRIEVLEDRGFDDDPDFVLVCECGWEAWSGDSERAVRHEHSTHAREQGEVHAASQIPSPSTRTPGG